MSLLSERMAAPLHFGPMDSPSAVGAVGNPACGDVVTLYLRIENKRIMAASFESVGSPYQLATASVLCDCVIGQTLVEAAVRGPNCVLRKLPDLPERNQYLARLAIDALRRAMRPKEMAKAADAGLVEVVEGEVIAFVSALLDARALGTLEIAAMAEAEGYRLPGGAARCLSSLRQRGLVQSQMSDDRRSWRWRMASAS